MIQSVSIARGVYQAELQGREPGTWERFRTILDTCLEGGLSGFEFTIARACFNAHDPIPKTLCMIESRRFEVLYCKACGGAFTDSGDLNGDRFDFCTDCQSEFEKAQFAEARAAQREYMTNLIAWEDNAA